MAAWFDIATKASSGASQSTDTKSIRNYGTYTEAQPLTLAVPTWAYAAAAVIALLYLVKRKGK